MGENVRTEGSSHRFPLTPRATLLAAVAFLALLFLILSAPAGAEITPLATFGSTGGGAGHFNEPTGLAIVPASGDLIVGDKRNHRVDELTAGGDFIHGFGWDVVAGTTPGTGLQVCTIATGCQTGTLGYAAGQFDRAASVALDGAGNIYVTNKGANRIDVFSPSGSFIRGFGWDVILSTPADTGPQVCTPVTGCQQGTAGGKAGELDGPRGIAVDSTGVVYVVDEFNHRVSEFTAEGAFIRAFGWDVIDGATADTGLQVCTTMTGCQPGTQGGEAGRLASPRGVAIDGVGNVDLADTGNNRISEFTPQGDFIRAFGAGVQSGSGTPQVCTTMTGCQQGIAGTGVAGEIYNPYGVAADSSGHVYVTEIGNQRVSEFTAQGDFLRAFGGGVATGGTDFQVCTSSCQTGTQGVGQGQFSFPEAVVTDCRGAVYIGEEQGNRIQRFGEPGTPLGPCPAPPQPQPQPLAQDFAFGKVKKNKKKGSATVTIVVPAAGQIEAGDANDPQVARAAVSRSKLKVRRVLRTAAGPGKVKVPIRPTRRGFKKLKHSGRLKTKLKFVYTATGAPSTTKTLKVTLILVRP